jgi:queuine tRNA-ribosyltransferase
MRLSMRWAERSRRPSATGPAMRCSASSRAGWTRDLREESAEALRAIGFDGYAVGGLAVGEGQEAMFGVLDYAPGMLPEDRPRYLMGVGKPDDIVGAVARGIDMMDCVLPSRSGRTGQAAAWSTSRTPATGRPAPAGRDLHLSRLPELFPRLPAPTPEPGDHLAMLLTTCRAHAGRGGCTCPACRGYSRAYLHPSSARAR